MTDKKTRQLWGREFDIVREGLDEQQVTGFGNDLTSQHNALLQQQEQTTSLRTLSERAVIEAEQVAAGIKARARKEAEAEAGRIITEARQKAQEMMIAARKRAEEATEKQVQDILLVARRKAEIIESEARQRAQMILIKARDKMEGELRGEVEGAYRRLLSSLQDLLTEGQDIGIEWNGKTIELWKDKSFELEGYEAALAQAVGVAEIAQKLPAERGMKPETTGEEKVALPARLQEETLAGVSSREELKPPKADEMESGEPAAQGTLEEAPSSGASGPLRAESQTLYSSQVEAAPPKAGQVESGETTAQAILDKKPGSEVKAPLMPASQALYSGEVILVLAPPVNMALFSQLHSHLHANSDLKIISTIGSWDQGTAITIALDKPMPLVGLLSGIPGITAKAWVPEKGGFLKRVAGSLSSKGKVIEKIEISSKSRHA